MKHILAFVTLALAVAFALAPAITSPFSGFEADQLPNPQIDPPIQPAGYAFAIWGLIYAWLVISALYGVWKRRDDAGWDAARKPLIVSLAIGVPWLAIANASAIWATITIVLMATFAVLALLRSPASDRWLLRAPIALYAGWLTAASWVSIGTTAAGYGLVFDAQVWALIGIAAALAIAAAVTVDSEEPVYAGTVIWALVGIVVANGIANPIITGAAVVGIVILLALAYKAGPDTPREVTS